MKEQFEEDNFVFVEEEHRSPEIITIDSDSESIADDDDDVICLDDDVVLLNDDDDKPQVLPNPAKDPHQAQPAAISASKAAQTSQNIKTANPDTFVNKTPSNGKFSQLINTKINQFLLFRSSIFRTLERQANSGT